MNLWSFQIYQCYDDRVAMKFLWLFLSELLMRVREDWNEGPRTSERVEEGLREVPFKHVIVLENLNRWHECHGEREFDSAEFFFQDRLPLSLYRDDLNTLWCNAWLELYSQKVFRSSFQQRFCRFAVERSSYVYFRRSNFQEHRFENLQISAMNRNVSEWLFSSIDNSECYASLDWRY